jgi:hypothetical protein
MLRIVRHRRAGGLVASVVTVLSAFAHAACGGNSTPPGPSPTPAPSTSSLVYSVPAGTTHSASSGNYTTDNAVFGGTVRTTCVPDPTIAGSVCPELMVLVRPFNTTHCSLWIDPPAGERLTPRSYRAERFAKQGIAGFSMNCARGGTTCNMSVGRFTLHELASNAAGVVTRLHVTFEQTCSNNDGSLYGAGTMTGELWIVNGTRGFQEAISG